MNFVEEDMVHETYEVRPDSTLIRIPNIRSIHNNENVCNNVNEPDRFHTILANIGEDDDVQLFSHFFTMIEESENNGIVARCLGCEKPYKAKSNVQSNLLKHLKRKHPKAHEIYEFHHKRSKVNNSTSQELSQSKFDDLLQKFLIDGLKTLSMVEEPAFKAFVYGLLHGDHGIQIPSRFKITQQIQNRFDSHKHAIRSGLAIPKHLCETVDIWSNKHRGFFGITVHWIDENSFERKSVALSCTHFSSPHTNDRIAERLQIVNHEYGISGKVDVVVSDNASNFVKALNEFGTDWSCFESSDNEYAVDHQSAVDYDIDFFDFNDCTLGCHHRCGSHTVNLIAKTDCLNALDDGFYCRMYQSAMKKVERLWSVLSQQKANETLFFHLNSSINHPPDTRWNYQFDSLRDVLKKDQEKLKLAMIDLRMDPMSTIDIDFLNEYLTVMEPLASLLDHLQQSDCYFGILLPSLYATKQKLMDLNSDVSVKYCKPLIRSILDGIDDRFGNILDFDTDIGQIAAIAACTHPFFKLKWIADSVLIDKVKAKLLRLAREIDDIVPVASNQIQPQSKKGGFEYRFLDSDVPQEALAKEQDVLQFLSTPRSVAERNLLQLNYHPIVRKIFLKYNTPITSSAPVERLFSYAGMILRPHRQKLSNEHFEALLLLNANKHFS